MTVILAAIGSAIALVAAVVISDNIRSIRARKEWERENPPPYHCDQP